MNYNLNRTNLFRSYSSSFNRLFNWQINRIKMPNTYSQIHIQFVFAVKYRLGLIQPQWKERLHQYITAIFQRNQHKMIAINSMPDHIHLLAGVRPYQAISDLIQVVKSDSTRWLKKEQLSSHFAWQDGFGAFSYSKSQIPAVTHYIQTQELHHSRISFREEYRQLLNEFEIPFLEEYIFKDLV